jgi:hypothetical protein
LQGARNNSVTDFLEKQCAVETAKDFSDTNMVQKFERVTAMSGHVSGRWSDIVENFFHFSLCLDETTDQIDVTQLLVFVRTVQSDFSAQEELLTLCSLKGTKMGIDIYEAVKKMGTNLVG